MHGPCEDCGETKKIVAHGRCSRCYEKAKPPIICSDCGQQRRPHKRIDDGILCARCWGLRNQVPCSTWSEVRRGVKGVREPRVCGRCWTATRPLIDCTWCGDRRKPGGRDEQGRPICPRC